MKTKAKKKKENAAIRIAKRMSLFLFLSYDFRL